VRPEAMPVYWMATLLSEVVLCARNAHQARNSNARNSERHSMQATSKRESHIVTIRVFLKASALETRAHGAMVGRTPRLSSLARSSP
jgi:hypothetical protein